MTPKHSQNRYEDTGRGTATLREAMKGIDRRRYIWSSALNKGTKIKRKEKKAEKW